MGNALNRITESEELTPSSSSSEVADRSRLSGLACVKRSRALRLGTISRGTSDVEEEARPRRRLFKLRRGYVAESIAASDSNDRVRNAIPLSSRSSSESSRVATQSQQDKRSQELDSIATAKTSPNPTAPSPTEHQISTTQLRNCTVCTEYLPPYRFPTRTPTTSCEHPPDTCRRCVRKWIRFSFLTRQWHHIDCPECDQRLQHEDLKAFADPELLGKYEALATKAAMEAIPGFRWCIGKRCDSGQVHEGEGTRFVCAKCKAEHCVMHDVPWHKKETCAEYEYRYETSTLLSRSVLEG
jgi:hypothetical protein